MLRASLGKVVHTVKGAGTYAAKVSLEELHKIAVHVRAVLYTVECIDLYLFTQGRGGVNWREGRGVLVYKGSKTNMTDCISSLYTLFNTSKDDI
jgi:hypothetical protein